MFGSFTLTQQLPMVLATSLILVTVFLPRFQGRWPLWIRVVVWIGILVLVTILLQLLLGSPLQPRFSTARTGHRFWEQLIEAGWWLVGARVAIGLARLFVVLENRPRETRIMSDLLAGAIVIATVLAMVNFAFEVPIRGLLATSGVIAIVLGLALQSSLSDVFSGIAVGLERPYKPGDLLWVEGGIEGHVIQVNWRSTQIATGDHNIAVVPNSVIAKARLVNRSAPTSLRGATVTIALDAAVPLERCKAALVSAVKACRIALGAPTPNVNCIGLQGDGAIWEIGFTVASSDALSSARTELFTEIHRYLRHAGIALAVVGTSTTREAPVPTLKEMLEQSDLFGVLEPEARAELLPYFQLERRRAGETLIRQGEAGEAIFIISNGTAEITIASGDVSHVVARMGPGESLGAVALISGQPTAATATAMTLLQAYRIGKNDIAAAIKARPELSLALEELARRGQDALRREPGHQDHAEVAHPEMFLNRLRTFLHLLASE